MALSARVHIGSDRASLPAPITTTTIVGKTYEVRNAIGLVCATFDSADLAKAWRDAPATEGGLPRHELLGGLVIDEVVRLERRRRVA